MAMYNIEALDNLYKFLYPNQDCRWFYDYDGNKQMIFSLSKDVVLNPLSLGYIITKEGYILPIEEGHGLTAISYLKKLYGSKWKDDMSNVWDIELLKAKAIIYAPLNKYALQYDSSWLPTNEIGTYLLYDYIFKLPSEQQRIIERINASMNRQQITPIYSVNYQFYDEAEMNLEQQKQYLNKSIRNVIRHEKNIKF